MRISKIDRLIERLTQQVEDSEPEQSRAALDRLEGLLLLRQQLDTRGWYALNVRDYSPLVLDPDY